MLTRLGFYNRWVRWIKEYLESSSVLELVNGTLQRSSLLQEGLDREILWPILIPNSSRGLSRAS